MNWNSPAEFFAMGGYALYVWGSFAACVLAVIVEVVLVRNRRSEILSSLRREHRADEIEAEGKAT
ncbi:hypothetical protein GCM10025771_38650 [Niveibacterium umoris]|uniref:Heme exporter protein D n=1 Tax=Niveibacterium umoris TaxID=1193620 RepID=A0A840BE09_9RHOO|nr:heme exporter protein CcmD [Niveibacterium umoris]MBB4010933.1 heme exporter protein D [Niveibacterium umoris]